MIVRQQGKSVRRGIALVAASTVVGLLAAGGAGAATKAPSRDAYIERADAICGRTTDTIDAAVEDLGLSPSDADARAAVDEVVALMRKELDKLRALTPPRGDARRVDRIYDAVERAADRVEADPESLFDDPGPFTRPARLAESYGFEECGKG